ncbi:hypothetical protein EI77_02307 [Prosthecobacter fusiformis]|uniref:Uncharacterized protein n=1 Tax=Prosthecobacter fusiformis TaxID=48464 RepID=A0A4R7S1U1_9BACT|nr:hypothetical protein EI77_02307 [Prosthecobacter fusiformis]
MRTQYFVNYLHPDPSSPATSLAITQIGWMVSGQIIKTILRLAHTSLGSKMI